MSLYLRTAGNYFCKVMGVSKLILTIKKRNLFEQAMFYDIVSIVLNTIIIKLYKEFNY